MNRKGRWEGIRLSLKKRIHRVGMVETETKPQAPPPPPAVPLKFYMSKTSTYVGKVLLKELSAPPAPTVPAPAASVTGKSLHTFFSSDTALDPSAQSLVAGTWPVHFLSHLPRKKPPSTTAPSC